MGIVLQYLMPGDLCTALGITSLSPLLLATDVTDATIGASGVQPETRTGAGGTNLKLFWPQPVASWTTGLQF